MNVPNMWEAYCSDCGLLGRSFKIIARCIVKVHNTISHQGRVVAFSRPIIRPKIKKGGVTNE